MSKDNSSEERVGQTYTLDDLGMKVPEITSVEGDTDRSVTDKAIQDETRTEGRLIAKLTLYISLFFGSLILYETVSLVLSVWNLHWIAGSVCLLAIVFIVFQIVFAFNGWLKGGRGIEHVRALQTMAKELSASRTHGKTDPLLTGLVVFYRNTLLEQNLNQVLEKMPDYLDDGECIAFVEREFVRPLDEKAYSVVRQYAIQTGIAVGASPFPALDALLTLWRNAMMISEIRAIYGVPPSLRNRLTILHNVLKNIAVTGLTEVSIDWVTDFIPSPLGKIGLRASQGVGSAVATARIGMIACEFCRPLPLSEEEEKSLLKKLCDASLLILSKRLNTGR